MQNKKQKTLPEGRSPLELVYALPNIRYTEYTTVSPREGPETTWYTRKKAEAPGIPECINSLLNASFTKS